jgi:hypothetical protein
MKTSRLPDRIVQRLRKEAAAWDQAGEAERERDVARQLEDSEVFAISRPAREPVSVRLDPRDIFVLKRVARRRGIPSSQLIALWVHERLLRESRRRAG